MQNIKNNIAKLEEWFDRINEKFYQNSLNRPVLTIAPDGKRSSYGWFTTWKAWREKGSDEQTYEINLSANFMDRDQEEIIKTLMHEMVHLYCRENNIQDTSRCGTYHNMKYKEEAEKHGLEMFKNEKYGWTITQLKKETKEWIKTLEQTVFIYREDASISRKGNDNSDDDEEGGSTGTTGTTGISKRKSSYKHVCPTCGNIARTTKVFPLICGECIKKIKSADDIKNCIMKIEN